MPFTHILKYKQVALWSDERLDLLENPSGWVRKCQACSDSDPYNDWLLWDNSDYIIAHCELLSVHWRAHSSLAEIEGSPAIWLGLPVPSESNA